MSLRDYQKEAIASIYREFRNSRSVLLQMPTGTGKTTVFSALIKDWVENREPNKKVLVIVHRHELVSQIINRLNNFGIGATRVQSGHETDDNSRVQVAMVQSLKKRERIPQNISLVVIDEAHHAKANSYTAVLDVYEGKQIKVLGVTATPCRLDGKGLKSHFGTMISQHQINWYIENGYLSKVKHLATALPDLRNIRIDPRKNDYDMAELYDLVNEDRIMADLIDSYIKHAEGKKAIVFALNTRHSRNIVARFIDKNIPAAYIDSKTPKDERDEIVSKFRSGEIQVLSNVDIFTEGFDCPDVEVVQLARPTKSLSLYLQQVGRVMRPAEGKEYGLILDNACLWQDHGLVTQPINWVLQEDQLVRDFAPLGTSSGNQPIDLNGPLPLELKGAELVEVSPPEPKDVPKPIRLNKLAREIGIPAQTLLEYYITHIDRPHNFKSSSWVPGIYIEKIKSDFGHTE